MSRWLTSCLLVCAFTLHAWSQDAVLDTLRPSSDSLLTDTSQVKIDTTLASGGVDTIVVYSCKDSIVFNVPSREMTLFRSGNVAYQAMGLTADVITVDWTSSVLTAKGVPDSTDTTGSGFRGTPVMKDGGEEYRGRTLSYNFRTKRGKIDLASTEMDQGYYYGEQIKKVDGKTLFVGAGKYTTCQDPNPHYYFGSPKMKVTMQGQIVAEPVYLYIADVPVFVLPFGVFPNKGGRRSGIIAPAIVEDSRRGRLLQHLGYYWAIDDYMDLNVRTDLYTKGSWALYSDYRYALKYKFSGGLSGYYKRFVAGESNDPSRSDDESYSVNLLHRQDINPTMRADVNFTFASDNSYLNTLDQRQLLNQQIISNATLFKNWEGTPNSISLNIRRSQNLRDGSVDETLPSINFNHSQSYPFRGAKASSDPSKLSFLEMIGVSYSASASNTRSKSKIDVGKIKTSVDGRDTVGSVSEFRRIGRQSVNQSVGFSISPKVGYLTVTPSLSYREERSFSVEDKPVADTADSTLRMTTNKDKRTAGTIYTGISAGTKLYGMIQPGVFGIAALRHTLTPSLSLVYAKQIVGEGASGKQLSMNFNVGNVFEMKKMADDEGKEGEKIQLLNVGAGVGYNFAADSLSFSAIGLSFRTDIGSILSVDGGASFDLYKLEQTGEKTYNRVNKFLLGNGGGLARMTNFRVSLSTSFSGEKSSREDGKGNDTTAVEPVQSGTFGLYQEQEPDFSIPWRLSLSLDYSENKELPSRYRSSSLRGNLEFNLTENWKFAVSGGYDVVNREIVVPNISISRDLHCWLMDFSWVPLGTNPYFRLEIRVKAPQLQDVKVTKQGSSRGIY